MECTYLPPKEIYDVLHEAEACGLEIPKEVELWWEKETIENEKARMQKK